MKPNKIMIFAAGSALLLSMLACNLGATQDPYEPLPPTVSQGLTESASVTETPTDIAPVIADSACTNPYQPVIVGATWNYKLTGPIPDTFIRSITSVESDGFSDQDVFGTGVTREGKWKCENGGLTALNPANGGSASVSSENVYVDFFTTESNGLTLPAILNTGDLWTQNTTIEGTEDINGSKIPAKNEYASTCKVAGLESITVEAGTFDAVKVDCQIVMNVTVTIQDSPIVTTVNFNATNWYAEKIGLLKTVTTGSGLDSSIELVSFNIP